MLLEESAFYNITDTVCSEYTIELFENACSMIKIWLLFLPTVSFLLGLK